MAEVRRLVADGEIGRVVVAAVEMSSGRTLLKGWRTDPLMAGLGVLNNVGVHAFDLLRFLLDSEVVEVSAMVSMEPGFELDTTALALLRFASGALAQVQVNQSVPHHQPDVVLYGTEGRVLGKNVTRPNLVGSLTVSSVAGERTSQVSSAGAYASTLRVFADAVLSGRPTTPSGEDGLISVQLIEALARSVAERRAVRLAE
jgi:1,5-anhydro-D-fructose reductase (1,5-anhydro-D-mannitol-forming)